MAPNHPEIDLEPNAHHSCQGPQFPPLPSGVSPTHGPDVAVPLPERDFRKVLMKTGLVLVVLGHVSFRPQPLSLHGTVLRYVAAPSDAVALQYCVVDILSVTSAIVVRPGWEDDWQEGWQGL